MISTPDRSRLALAACVTLYVGALAAVGFGPFTGIWGLNSIHFVAPAGRVLCLASGVLGLLLMWRGWRGGPPARGRQEHPLRALPRGAAIAAGFAAAALLLWAARDRSHFLGDGRIWIDNLRAGRFPHYSEPLSAAIWRLFTWLLQGLGVPPGPDALAVLSVASGLAAGLLLAWVVREAVPAGARTTAFGLLATLGASMLYFGYIEIYPIVSLAVLGYVLAALRCLRGGMPAAALAAAFAVAMGSHLVCLYLLPSYAYVVLRSRPALWKGVALAVAPFVLVAMMFALLHVSLTDAARPFGVLSVALRSTAGRSTPSLAALLGMTSDLASVLLLVLPVPFLLYMTGRAPSLGAADGAATAFLRLAALPGILAAILLVVPGSPAQDWDLMAITVLPLAILAVREGAPMLEGSRRSFRLGLVATSIAGLAPFVLVNASEPGALARLASLVGPESRLSAHERAYGNEKVARTYMARRAFAAALPFARASWEAEPSNARYWTNLGEVLNELGRCNEAIPLLRRAVELAPERWDSRYDLGLCLVKQERYAEAAQTLHRAVAAGGDRPDVRHLWGIALFRSGQSDSAVVVWRGILERWPEYAARLRGGATPGGLAGETTAP